jgi:hypothetical protein
MGAVDQPRSARVAELLEGGIIIGPVFLVVRTQGNDRAYWGAPFGALAIRLEALFL